MLQHNSPTMGGAKAMITDCKPNYEELIVGISKRLNVDEGTLVALIKFVQQGSGQHLQGDDHKTIHTLIGELSIIVPDLKKEYSRLLELHEKEA